MMTMNVQELLDQVVAVLPISQDEVIYKGIAAGVSERIVELKRASGRLQAKYDSTCQLEQLMAARGVSPDDHTLYTDLLEWRAIDAELIELFHLLEIM